MKRFPFWVAFFLLASSVGAARIVSLPAEFANYRSWKTQTKTPYMVPYDLAMRCMAPKESEWEAARQEHGPHTKQFIQIYLNQAAQKAIKKADKKEFPIGSVLAKEKFAEPSSGPRELSGIAFMIKRSKTEFPETGGWEFLYFPSAKDERTEIHNACAGCHKTAAHDFIFNQPPPQIR